MANHTKRTNTFWNSTLQMIIKVMAIQTVKPEDKVYLKNEVAKVLEKYTTDSACILKAKETEPIFVLQAGDPVAARVLAFWITESESKGFHKDKIADAKVALKEFIEYKP